MQDTKFPGYRSTGSGKENFEGYHIWEWRPSLSCDPDAANKPSFCLILGGSTYNLVLIGQAGLEEIFEK